MLLVKKHFYGFYSLVNIHSFFIRTVQVKYWGNNLDLFESDRARIRSPGRAWGTARIPFSQSPNATGAFPPLFPPPIQFARASVPAPDADFSAILGRNF